MTPEHRAELTTLLRENQPLKDFEELIERAIESECADLAQACEELTTRRAAEMGIASYEHLTGWQCAALIRARGKVEIPEEVVTSNE